MKKRLFFASYPDLPVRRALCDLQLQIDCGGRAVAPENLHLTLAFLGACEAAMVERIHTAASGVRAAPFSLRLTRCEMLAKQRLLVAAPTDVPPELLSLRKRLLRALQACDICLKGRFYPHVTLFRNAKPPLPLKELPQEIEWRMTSFALTESALRSDRAHYKNLCEYQLDA